MNQDDVPYISPERIDKEEDARVKAMREAARKRPHLSFSSDKSKRARDRRTFTFRDFNIRPLSPAALGDMIRRKIIAQEKAIALQDAGICHVKNGKPLTEYGAKLLGVEWPVKEA